MTAASGARNTWEPTLHNGLNGLRRTHDRRIRPPFPSRTESFVSVPAVWPSDKSDVETALHGLRHPNGSDNRGSRTGSQTLGRLPPQGETMNGQRVIMQLIKRMGIDSGIACYLCRTIVFVGHHAGDGQWRYCLPCFREKYKRDPTRREQR